MLLVSSWTAPELQEGTRSRMVSRRERDDRQDTCLSSPAIPSENCNIIFLTCSLRLELHSCHTQNPFLFRARLNSSVLRQHSGVIRAAVALLSQPSGPPAALDQSERATVANLSLIG